MMRNDFVAAIIVGAVAGFLGCIHEWTAAAVLVAGFNIDLSIRRLRTPGKAGE